MKWKELDTFIPQNISNVMVDVKTHHDYYIYNGGFFIRVSDMDGNTIRVGEGTFNTGKHTTIMIEATDISLVQLNYGERPMAFSPRVTSDSRPAAIHVNVPTDAIAKTGLTLKQFGQLVNSITAAGVGAEVLFEGTFSFSSDYFNHEPSENGFADMEQTVGGTLGYAYDPADNTLLPI